MLPHDFQTSCAGVGAVETLKSIATAIPNRVQQLGNAYSELSQGNVGPAVNMAIEGHPLTGVANQFGRTADIAQNLATGNYEAAAKGYGSHLTEGAVMLVAEGATGVVRNVASNKITVSRGVNESSPAFSDAANGTVNPRGGSATPTEHNAGNTQSSYTSWTTNPAVAENSALRPNGSGVVLEKTISTSKITRSPSLKSVNLKQSPGTVVNESEVLLRGKVSGANVRKVNQ